MLALELYQAVLTESMGLLPEVALRSEGTPNTFSYRHGETARLQDGLTAIGPKQVENRVPPGSEQHEFRHCAFP